MMNKPKIYFILGTRAQFIKVAPIMRKMLDQNLCYSLIYTAQHRENIDEILEIYNLPSPNVTLYHHNEANTKSSFIKWFLVMFSKAIFCSKKYIPDGGIVLTHGDTLNELPLQIF